MYSNLFKSPLRFSQSVAEKITRRLFLRFNSLALKEDGDFLVRLMDALNTFFSRMRKSMISDEHLVNPMEGPSSTKFNGLMTSMVDDIDNIYGQQNAVDKSIVETHNLLEMKRRSIESALRVTSAHMAELTAIAGSVDAAVVTFEDSFDTKAKHDEKFPTALEQADVDIVAGIIRLAGGAKPITKELIQKRQLRVFFDGTPVERDNTFSWGKLYGDPRDLGENGIRATFKIISVSEDVVSQGEQVGGEEIIPDRPPSDIQVGDNPGF